VTDSGEMPPLRIDKTIDAIWPIADTGVPRSNKYALVVLVRCEWDFKQVKS